MVIFVDDGTCADFEDHRRWFQCHNERFSVHDMLHVPVGDLDELRPTELLPTRQNYMHNAQPGVFQWVVSGDDVEKFFRISK